jgi:hypothetical protein
MFNRSKKVETVSPNTVVYEMDSTSTYEYWFAYLNALLDVSEMSGKSGGGRDSSRQGQATSTHATSLVYPGVAKARSSEILKASKMAI